MNRKVAIVAGGSRGSGRAAAEALAREGLSVVVNHAGDADAAEETVRRIRSRGGDAVTLQLRLDSVDSARTLFDSVLEAYGRIDVLVVHLECVCFSGTEALSSLLWQGAQHLGGRARC